LQHRRDIHGDPDSQATALGAGRLQELSDNVVLTFERSLDGGGSLPDGQVAAISLCVWANGSTVEDLSGGRRGSAFRRAISPLSVQFSTLNAATCSRSGMFSS